MKTITFKDIYDKRPCASGWAKLCNNIFDTNFNSKLYYSQDMELLPEQFLDEITIEQILNNCGLFDAFWTLRCFGYIDYCDLNADIAKSVLHIYESKFDSKSPRLAIESIYRFKKGEITYKSLATIAAAAAIAVKGTVNAPDAAFAAYAAYAAATVNARACSASVCARSASRKKQRILNEKLMRNWIERNK